VELYNGTVRCDVRLTVVADEIATIAGDLCDLGNSKNQKEL
jgi:hypothetical protein